MSVRYSAVLGYGFMVNRNDLDEMEERGTQLLDKFQESDYALPVDAYDPDTSRYFFGIIRCRMEPGHIAQAPTNRNCDHNMVLEMIDEYKMYCPNRSNYIPSDHVMCCID